MGVHLTAEDGANTHQGTLRTLVWPWMILALYLACYGFALYVTVVSARTTMHIVCPPIPHGPLNIHPRWPPWLLSAITGIRVVMVVSVVAGLLGPLWSLAHKQITRSQAAYLATFFGAFGLIVLFFVVLTTHGAAPHPLDC